jgi:hypothetical protein
MASKRRVRRLGCRGKVAHASEGAAYSVLRRYPHEYDLRAYECPFCRKWHTGRNPEGGHKTRREHFQ